MKKFEDVVHEELQKNEVFFEEYNGNFILSDEKGVLLRKNGRLIIFPWLKFARDWVSPEDYQNTVASNKAFEKSNLVLSKENAKFVVENIELQKQITELKSQLEKQQPEITEVPQFVGEWLDRKPLYAINGFIPVEIIEWSKKQTGYADLGMNINHLIKLKVNGCTVAKEKRFYLKHIEMSKRDTYHDYYAQIRNERFEHDSVETGTLPQPEITGVIFTQKEINNMETGSYEQVEVAE